MTSNLRRPIEENCKHETQSEGCKIQLSVVAGRMHRRHVLASCQCGRVQANTLWS